MNNSRFQRGSGCYKCIGCGKMTRDTGHDEASCELCRLCFEKSGLGNTLSDNSEGFDEMFSVDPWTYMDEAADLGGVGARFAEAVSRLKQAGKWHGE